MARQRVRIIFQPQFDNVFTIQSLCAILRTHAYFVIIIHRLKICRFVKRKIRETPKCFPVSLRSLRAPVVHNFSKLHYFDANRNVFVCRNKKRTVMTVSVARLPAAVMYHTVRDIPTLPVVITHGKLSGTA